jgi:uncharacterized protein
MYKRLLSDVCFEPEFGRQMRFITGPRQCGKTTLAKQFLKENLQNSYYNFDQRDVRNRLRKEEYFYENDILNSKHPDKHKWVCFDELHKIPKWKNILKGYFDRDEGKINFILTGSARLDLFRRSGDSLAGRYFLFKLMPLSLSEIAHKNLKTVDFTAEPMDFIDKKLSSSLYEQDLMKGLLEYSGFPEPLTSSNKRFYQKWHNDYIDRLINEDIRDLTMIRELEHIATLLSLLPVRIGNPLSVNSLREDMYVSYNAVKNYIKALELSYILFSIKPYSKKIARTIKKESKYYYFDYTWVTDEAARFENYIAVELKTLIEYWNGRGDGNFELYYLRNREGKESDFLILADGKPWMIFEAKLNDEPVASHHIKNAGVLGNIPVVQLCKNNKIAHKSGEKIYRISASRFFI